MMPPQLLILHQPEKSQEEKKLLLQENRKTDIKIFTNLKCSRWIVTVDSFFQVENPPHII